MWGAIAGAVISGVMAKQAANKSARAQERAARMGAERADPFYDKRGPFQDLLLKMYGFDPEQVEQGLTGPTATFTETGGALEMAVPGEDRMKRYTSLDQYLGDVKRSNEYRGFDGGAQGAKNMLIAARARWAAAERAATDVEVEPAEQYTREGQETMQDRLRNLPGYQFALSEMIRGSTRAGAATGALRSGGLQAEITERAGGLAEGTYASEMQRLMTLAGANKGSPGTAGSLLAQGLAGAGQTRAAGTMGMGSALGYAIGQFGQGGGTQTSGTTTWGDRYTDKGYGPVISRDEFSGWGGEA